ncbi:MAG: hypothetical protein SWX82_10495 [Cyanobacteriota bacterium]|nr:hypothetical protein [Cyanobacteriota bacterium]
MVHTDYGTDTRIGQGGPGVVHTDYGTDTRIGQGGPGVGKRPKYILSLLQHF